MVEASQQTISAQVFSEVQRLNDFRFQFSDKWLETNAPKQVLIQVALHFFSQVDINSIQSAVNEIEKFVKSLLEAKCAVNPQDTYKAQVLDQLILESISHFRWYKSLLTYQSEPEKFQQIQSAFLKSTVSTSEEPIKVYCSQDNWIWYGNQEASYSLATMPQVQLAAQILFDQQKQKKIGVVAAGPAGTGKTETFKYIGARLGYDFIVINCSDEFEIQQIAHSIEEAFAQGNSVIFDEFNRCSIETAEGLTSLMQELQAIKQKFTLPLQANERNTTQTGQFNGHEITIKASSMIILTVNPGYQGRTEVPKEFYEFCSRMEFLTPQLELLIPAVIAQQGICNDIQQIENLGPKLIGVFNNLKERASKQSWYDFGLRAYMQIIKIAQTIKKHEKIESVEEIFLLAIAMKYQVLLVQQDIPIFVEVLNSQFPNAQEFILNYRKSKLEQPAVQEKIKNAFAEAQLPLPLDIVGDQLLLKASYIAKVQNIGTGVLLYGDYQKSDQLLNLSSKLVKQLSGSDIVLHDPIDFDSQNYEQLYEQPGSIVNTTQQAVEDQSGKLHWIFLKGAIHANKIENLNTVLDANQVLFLNNGQRINIPNNVKFIFQTNNLDMASPAFISRVVFVNAE